MLLLFRQEFADIARLAATRMFDLVAPQRARRLPQQHVVFIRTQRRSLFPQHATVRIEFTTDRRQPVEPSFGLTRALMAFLVDAYDEEQVPNAKGGTDKRTVLRLDPRLAPVKVAVLPLSRNEALSPLARGLADRLRKRRNVDFDDSGAIGRRYRRQDEIGTPLAVTVDFDSLEDDAVTVRDRDTIHGVIRATEIPYVILTSNGTREISDALRRRCLYQYVDYPSFERELLIVRTRAPEVPERLARQIVEFVQSVRQMDLRRKPGLAETLDWVAALLRLGVSALDEDGVERVMDSLAALVKTREDQAGLTRPVVEKLVASC